MEEKLTVARYIESVATQDELLNIYLEPYGNEYICSFRASAELTRIQVGIPTWGLEFNPVDKMIVDRVEKAVIPVWSKDETGEHFTEIRVTNLYVY